MTIDLLETDPPYNVAVKSVRGDTIKNDDMADDDFKEFLYCAFSNACAVLKPGGAFYIWHADNKTELFREAADKAALVLHQTLIWVKSQFSMCRSDYQWQHEPCLYGWKEGAAHYFINKRNLSTVAESICPDFDAMSKEELIEYLHGLYDYTTIMYAKKPLVADLHPTMKPISLIRYQVKNSTKPGENVLDLFGGSGTTLLACEEIDRNCYMMEYDPKYAEVIIGLWEEKTGGKAQLISRR